MNSQQHKIRSEAQAFDLIAAAAGGYGGAAINIIRVSGAGVFAAAARCLRTRKTRRAPEFGESIQWRTAYRFDFVEPNSLTNIDDVMVSFFQGPKSYTGEDLMEICCHGSPYVVQTILAALYKTGARAAEPGEFTKRAFLKGKMDLTQAEGIHELIQAQTSSQWQSAQQMASGRLATAIRELRAQLVGAMAITEAMIDFPDEGETAALQTNHAIQQVELVRTQIAELLGSYQSGRVASEGLRVVIIGAPNAGKSTLLNSLLGTERAIVTDVAGTTRDYIEERCLINGRLILLTDTAGVRESEDRVESIGIRQSIDLAKRADVILFLVAADSSPEAGDVMNLVNGSDGAEVIRVLSKCDLPHPAWADDHWQAISCVDERGLVALKERLARLVDRNVSQLSERLVISSGRHKDALEQAQEALTRFFAAASEKEAVECLAFELQQACRYLQTIIGSVSGDDVLDQIFSKFCIGK